MTTKELNRDFKRLHKAFKGRKSGDTTNWTLNDWMESTDQDITFKKELIRLYDASDKFHYANRLSILIFIEMNNSIRALQFHLVQTKL